jgi:hypothetical protein
MDDEKMCGSQISDEELNNRQTQMANEVVGPARLPPRTPIDAKAEMPEPTNGAPMPTIDSRPKD